MAPAFPAFGSITSDGRSRPSRAPQRGPARDPAWILADGRNDYEQHCAACHGEEGKGDGRMASILILPPPDLTEITKRYDGDFPFWRIYAIIDGSDPVEGHDTFQMPEGQTRFRRSGDWPGARPAYLRILELTHYLESFQLQ